MLLEAFERALRSLGAGCQQSTTDLEIDGTIQRFEFTYEFFWKTLHAQLEHEGDSAMSPRACIKRAYQLGIVSDEEGSLEMIADRNRSVHLYDEKVSHTIFERIKKPYLTIFQETLRHLRERSLQ